MGLLKSIANGIRNAVKSAVTKKSETTKKTEKAKKSTSNTQSVKQSANTKAQTNKKIEDGLVECSFDSSGSTKKSSGKSASSKGSEGTNSSTANYPQPPKASKPDSEKKASGESLVNNQINIIKDKISKIGSKLAGKKLASGSLLPKATVTKEDYDDLSTVSHVILNPNSYEKKEVKVAKDYVKEAKNQFFDTTKDDVRQYKDTLDALDKYANSKLLSSSDKIKIRNVVSKFCKEANRQNGASPNVINALENIEKELGTKETKGANHGDMEKYYQKPSSEAGNAWCATFASWAYGESQGTTNNDTFGYEIAVRNLRAKAERAGYYGKVGEYQPQPGDVFIQEGVDSLHTASHTGIYVGEDSEYVYTIEGNADDQVLAKKYKKDGHCYNAYMSGYVKMNEWKGGLGYVMPQMYIDPDMYVDADELFDRNKRATL